MLPIPGKACAECNLCCQVLEIEEFAKPAGELCEHCHPGHGCAVYLDRRKFVMITNVSGRTTEHSVRNCGLTASGRS